jgi:hypothetical protein
MNGKESDSHAIYEHSRITKVIHTKSDNALSACVYVFCGSQYPAGNVPQDDDASYFDFIKKTGFFSPAELVTLEEMASKRNQIILVNDRINMDDTVTQLKLKILKHIRHSESDTVYPLTTRTMYLYSKFTQDLTLQSVFNELNCGNKAAITGQTILNYLSNIHGAELVGMRRVGSNHTFSYNDLGTVGARISSQWKQSKHMGVFRRPICTVPDSTNFR